MLPPLVSQKFLKAILLVIGIVSISLGLINVIYIGWFLKSPLNIYPIEIIYSLFFVLGGTFFLGIFFEFQKLDFPIATYQKFKNITQTKEYLNNSKKLFLLLSCFLILPTTINHRTNFRLRFLFENQMFYIFTNLLFLALFALASFVLCLAILNIFIQKIRGSDK